MTLTKLQLKSLKLYQCWHTHSLTVAGIIRTSLWSWFALAFSAVIGCLLVLGGWSGAGCLLIGIALGSFLRDVGRFRVLFHVWPVHHEVTDWGRVKEMIEAHEKVTHNAA